MHRKVVGSPVPSNEGFGLRKEPPDLLIPTTCGNMLPLIEHHQFVLWVLQMKELSGH